jgi:hypothetical protein
MSFRVDPPQPCYKPDNAVSGVTRPHAFTNLWKSDSSRPLPQWLQLSWDAPQELRTVELTFPGHLIREYHAYGPFYRDPQCPRDYLVEAWVNQRWEMQLEVKDNYQRHRRHRLSNAVRTSAIRIVVTATNGDPSAAIYEVRCYASDYTQVNEPKRK